MDIHNNEKLVNLLTEQVAELEAWSYLYLCFKIKHWHYDSCEFLYCRPTKENGNKPSLIWSILSTGRLFQTSLDGILVFRIAVHYTVSNFQISVFVSLAFDKWDGGRWRRRGNVSRLKREGVCKRILWLDVMHASICVHSVAQVSGFYLSKGRHWGIHTSGQMQMLAVNHNLYSKVNACMCLTETKRDALWGCGCAYGNISMQILQFRNIFSNFHWFHFPSVFSIIYKGNMLYILVPVWDKTKKKKFN